MANDRRRPPDTHAATDGTGDAGTPVARDRATLAAAYDREWTDAEASQPHWAFWRFRGSARDVAERQLDLSPGARLLDLASGNGATTVRHAAAGAAVITVELSRMGLHATRRRAAALGLASEIAPIQADVQHLPLAASSVDLVYGENFLMYVNPAVLGRECARVLRPGGRAVLLEPTAHHPLIRLYRRFGSPYRTTAPRYFPLDDIAHLAAPFAAVWHREFYLTSVLALPLARWPRLFALAFHLLDSLDRLLWRAVPALRKFGWLTVIVLTLAPMPVEDE